MKLHIRSLISYSTNHCTILDNNNISINTHPRYINTLLIPIGTNLTQGLVDWCLMWGVAVEIVKGEQMFWEGNCMN